ncbi:hypothetical protein [Microbacterium sp. A94]|uniref:hypothetical protein n=1 Tax=Microbacterium sp. A94 TaxID=3450717 RepID=UPI003F442BDE
MTRLLWAELRRGWASWAGLIAVTTISALTFSVAIAMLERGLREGGEILEASTSFLSVLLIFNIPGGAIVIAAIARLAVDLHRPVYARWQLSGVGPAQTSTVVLVQLACMGVIGGVLGYAASIAIVPAFLNAVFAQDTGWWADATITPGTFTACIVIPLTVIVTLLGGLRAAVSAGRTPPLAALRDPEPQAKRMRWWRWVLFLIVLFAAGAGVIAPLRAEARSTVISQFPLLPAFLMMIVAAAGPVLYPLVLRGWTAVIPARASTSWYLARHQARYHLSRSTASITPLFVGASLLGGLMTMSATTNAAMDAAGLGGNFDLDIMQVMLLVGGPVLLGTVGAAVVIFMSNRTQGAEQALLRASGATERTVLASALWQGVIHVVTACLLAGLVLVGTAVVAATALARFIPAIPVVDVGAASLLAALGLVLTASATVLPGLVRLREPVARQLAAA